MSAPESKIRTEFFVTFGAQYRDQLHPTLSVAHPDGWVTVVAQDYDAARALAIGWLGTAWCDIYSEKPDLALFPLGELWRLEREPETGPPSQTYYAECLPAGEQRGLRMSVTLAKPGQSFPDLIPAFTCLSTECPCGGTHDLLPISETLADELMADEPMTKDEDPAHDAECWRHHDDCALTRAESALEADQSTERRRAALITVRYGIADHAIERCPSPGDCYAATVARAALAGEIV
ncbi:MAG: hypothetical protein ACRDSP_14000 [Pseudonocardiaceae bacterium]